MGLLNIHYLIHDPLRCSPKIDIRGEGVYGSDSEILGPNIWIQAYYIFLK